MLTVEMELLDVEAALIKPTGFRQSWRERFCNPSFTTKIIYACLLIVVIVASVIIYISWASDDTKESVNIPDSELENTAAYYMKSLDRKLQPCQDFYAFACRNLRHEYRKESNYGFDTMAMMERRILAALGDLLTKPLNTSDCATLRQMKIFYQMCVNTTKIEKEGIEPVLTVLNEIGGWPLLRNDWESNENWEEIVGSVNRAGFATFFPYFMDVERHPNNSFRVIMTLKPLLDPTRPQVLPRNYLTLEYVRVVASLLNATNDRLDEDVMNIMDFENDLYWLTYSVIPNPHILTYKSLLIQYPEIPWKSFFRNIFVSTGIEVSSNESVLVHSSEYNVNVFKLLNKTPAKIIRNYVVWRLIVEAIPMMPEKFRLMKNAFQMRTVGQSRNQDCLDTLIDKAKVSIGYLYIKHFFDKLAKNKSDDMIKNIESQAYPFLTNISWMDKGTKKRIIETLKNLEMTVPHPDDNIDVMESLEFRSNDTTFANYRRLIEAHRNLEYSKLKMSEKVYRRLIPFETALTAGAWYFPSTNTSFMMAAIFQRPFFSGSQPMYLNYGGIGFTMAHEMTHGLKILSVCDNKECPSFDRFQEMKGCMEKLYGGYVLKQLNRRVDGKRTLEENVGDLIGLKLSYRAYEEFAKDSEEQLLPGLNYTARQWFWINAATSFCTYESDAGLEDVIANNPHSPAEARVNVAFANTEEFSRDFECPIGSRMNPARKCTFEGSGSSFNLHDSEDKDEL